MANIKFSAFTAEADIANFDDIVGYQGVVNKKITPANLATSLEPLLPFGSYLPLAGGTMTGVAGVVVPDNFKWNFGTLSALEIYHDGANSYIDEVGVGNLIVRAANYFKIYDIGGNVMATFKTADSVDLYFNNNKKLETTATGTLTTGDSDMTGGISRTLGARVMQEYTWPNGTPVGYANWANGVFSNLPYDPTPTIDVTDCNVANYGWVCTNAGPGGAAGQEATFTLGAAGAGTWRIKVISNWYDQTANVITEGRLNINGTSYEVIAEAAVESSTDKIYYGEKIITLAAGATVQFGMIFTGGGVTPFPSVGTTGNTPNSIYFEKVL